MYNLGTSLWVGVNPDDEACSSFFSENNENNSDSTFKIQYRFPILVFLGWSLFLHLTLWLAAFYFSNRIQNHQYEQCTNRGGLGFCFAALFMAKVAIIPVVGLLVKQILVSSSFPLAQSTIITLAELGLFALLFFVDGIYNFFGGISNVWREFSIPASRQYQLLNSNLNSHL